MSDTIVDICKLCHKEGDCINGVCSNCAAAGGDTGKDRCPECGAELIECIGKYEGGTFDGARCPNGCDLAAHYC